MPIEINVGDISIKLYPDTEWKSIKTKVNNIELSKNYYIESKERLN